MSPSENLLPGGRIIEDMTVPARAPWSALIARGDMLRLIDLEGQQAIDFLCFNAEDPAERYHAANTIKVPGNIFIGEGTVLRSSLARPMMTVVTDTCGRHDTIFGCCSYEIDEVRYGKTNTECCQRNFERELAKHGVGPEHIVPNINFFMYVPVDSDGAAGIADALSKPGRLCGFAGRNECVGGGVELPRGPQPGHWRAGSHPHPRHRLVPGITAYPWGWRGGGAYGIIP
jgi:urea carboxylase-associated protein 1